MNREECLKTAIGVCKGEREKRYGSPEDNFARIAAYWTLYLQRHIRPADVATMMILMKTARLQNDITHEDSWVDIAGYAGCGCQITTVKETS